MFTVDEIRNQVIEALKADGEALEPMIGEVNGQCVRPEERLSNSLFKFDENGLTVFEG